MSNYGIEVPQASGPYRDNFEWADFIKFDGDEKVPADAPERDFTEKIVPHQTSPQPQEPPWYLMPGESLVPENPQDHNELAQNPPPDFFNMLPGQDWDGENFPFNLDFAFSWDHTDGQNNRATPPAFNSRGPIENIGVMQLPTREHVPEFSDKQEASDKDDFDTLAPPPSQNRHDIYQGLISTEREFEVRRLSHHPSTVRKVSDFPRDAAGQRFLVGRLFEAIRNTDDVLDNPKVAKSFREGDFSDLDVEIACWELLIAARDAQEKGRLVARCHDSRFEEYATFSDRFETILVGCRTSKAYCKSILQARFSHRAADQPGAELKRKNCNQRLNYKKTKQNKAGQEAFKQGFVDDEGNWDSKVEVKPLNRTQQGHTRTNKRARDEADDNDTPAPKRLTRPTHEAYSAQRPPGQSLNVGPEYYDDEEFEGDDMAALPPTERIIRQPRGRNQSFRLGRFRSDPSASRQREDEINRPQKDDNIDPQLQCRGW